MHSQGVGTARDAQRNAPARLPADLHRDLLGQSRALPGQGSFGPSPSWFRLRDSHLQILLHEPKVVFNWREDKGNFWGTAHLKPACLAKTKTWQFLEDFSVQGRGGDPHGGGQEPKDPTSYTTSGKFLLDRTFPSRPREGLLPCLGSIWVEGPPATLEGENKTQQTTAPCSSAQPLGASHQEQAIYS